jgi:hypothetical protein
VFSIDDSNPNYDVVNRIFQNVGTGQNTGGELLLTQDVGRHWELSGSLNLYNNLIYADEVTLLFPVERPFIVAESFGHSSRLSTTPLETSPKALKLPDPPWISGLPSRC